jgi:hypothetical protein
VIRHVVRNLDLRRDLTVSARASPALLGRSTYSVSASNAGIARVQGRVVDAPALGILESLACEPVVPPAWLSLLTVCIVSAGLPAHISAWECTLFEAGLCSLLLSIRREIPRHQELVDERLVLANAVGEHAAVVAVVVNTPLDINHITTFVGDHWCRTPARSRLIVIHTDASIVTARPTAANSC